MEDKINLEDSSGDRKYFTQVPNYVLNHSTANDQALYFQMKKFAGKKGLCYATKATLRKKLGIGKQALNKSLQYLLDKGWVKFAGKISIETRGGIQQIDSFSIVDIWKINIEYYENEGGAETDALCLQGGAETAHPPLKGGAETATQGGAETAANKINLIKEDKDSNILKAVSEIYQAYQQKIHGGSRLTDGAKAKLKARLNSYSVEDLLLAIEKFSKTAWWMEHCKDKGVAWFFKNDDQIDRFLNIKCDILPPSESKYGKKVKEINVN